MFGIFRKDKNKPDSSNEREQDMLDGITAQTFDLIVISDIGNQKYQFQEILETLHGYSLKDANQKRNFTDIVNDRFDQEDNFYYSYIGYHNSNIIIKEPNIRCYYSDFYLKKITSFFPNATISFISLTPIGHISVVHGKLRVIKNGKPLFTINGYENYSYDDFGNKDFDESEIEFSKIIKNEENAVNAVLKYLNDYIKIKSFKEINLHKFYKVSFEELYIQEKLNEDFLKSVCEFFPTINSDMLFSRSGRGRRLEKISQVFRQTSMPLLKDLKSQVLNILSRSFERDGFVLKKSKYQLVRKTPTGENIIALDSFSTNYSEFNILVFHRNDMIEKLDTDFKFKNGFSTNSNYKNGYTIACRISNRCLFGSIIALSYSALALQLSQSIEFIRTNILPQISEFESIESIDRRLNEKVSLENIDFFSDHVFSGQYPSSITSCIVAIIAKNKNVEYIIDKCLKDNKGREHVIKGFFDEIKGNTPYNN